MGAKTRSSFANITSSLTVYNVTLNDMGNFYCVVDNGIGSESNKSAFLVVKREYLLSSVTRGRVVKNSNYHSSMKKLVIPTIH